MSPNAPVPEPEAEPVADTILFRVLGTVSVTDRGSAVFQARRSERLLLGLLALEPGKWLGIDRLAQLLWGDSQPSQPRRTMQVYVSRLRPQLPAALRYQAGAYQLDTDPDTVDAHRFTGLVTAARGLSDPAERAAMLRRALRLWQGPVLGDAADDSLRDRLGAGLDQLHLTAMQLKVEADLDLGNHELLVSELAQLTAEYPGHDRLVAAHMTALHRCGRTEEALAQYRRHRRLLREEYGLDPTRELDRLHGAILRGDAVAPPAPPVVDKPAQLPPGIVHFVGREAEWRRLLAPPAVRAEDRPRVVVIDGPVGTGKSALAVRFGHAAAEQYPDGSLYLDLRGFTDDGSPPLTPKDALERLLRSLSVTDADMPVDLDTRAAELRSRLATRRLILVLDNAADAEQVIPLIPAGPDCLVLITSRQRLSELDGAERVTLSALAADEADDLFHSLCERPDIDAEIVSAVTRSCGRLPLAIRTAATLLRDQPQWTPERLLDRLRRGRALPGVDAGRRSITTAMDASLRKLSAPARRMFRLLALTPVLPFDADCAAALADVTGSRADELLTELVTARVLEPDEAGYRLDDLHRQYAGTLVHQHEPASKHRSALRRLVHHCLAVARTATYRLTPGGVTLTADRECPNPVPVPVDRASALARLDTCRRLLRQVILIGHMQELHDQVARMCGYLTVYYRLGHHLEDWRITHELGLDSAERIGDVSLRAQLQYQLAQAHEATGEVNLAVKGYRSAADQFTHIHDPVAHAAALIGLGRLRIRTGHDDHVEAGVAHLEEAHRICVRARDRDGEAAALIELAAVAASKQDPDQALTHYRTALRLFIDRDDAAGRSRALSGIGDVLAQTRDDEAARETYALALDAARTAGTFIITCETLEKLGAVYLKLNLPAPAEQCHAELAALLSNSAQSIPSAGRMRQAVADTFEVIGRSAEAAELRRLTEVDSPQH